jgi:multiple antibiotic resistance protein
LLFCRFRALNPLCRRRRRLDFCNLQGFEPTGFPGKKAAAARRVRNFVVPSDSPAARIGRMDLHLLKPLVALLAIVNPIGAIPFFLHFTQNLTREQRKRTVRVASIASFMVVGLSAVCGLQIIEFFGITIASFQVGGGLLLLISSMNMLNAQQAESRGSDVGDGQAKADAGDSIAIVPLTIPLLTGPATISTMVIYADKTRTLVEHAVLVGYGVVIGAATFAAFSAAGRIARLLGRTGINVMTRLMGLILAAMAVELLSDGLLKLFPALSGLSGGN